MSYICIFSIEHRGVPNLPFIALLLLKRITFSYVYKCWPKTNSKYFSSKDGLIQDQQRIASQALHPWWVEVHPCTSPSRQEKKTFYGEGKEGEKAGINKEFVAFHWLSPCQERSPCWAALSLQGVRAPPSGLSTLIEISFYYLFLTVIFMISFNPIRWSCVYFCFTGDKTENKC